MSVSSQVSSTASTKLISFIWSTWRECATEEESFKKSFQNMRCLEACVFFNFWKKISGSLKWQSWMFFSKNDLTWDDFINLIHSWSACVSFWLPMLWSWPKLPMSRRQGFPARGKSWGALGEIHVFTFPRWEVTGFKDLFFNVYSKLPLEMMQFDINLA